MKDPELEAWRSEWQALGGREGLAQELTKRAVDDGRRIRRGIVRELAASAFAVVLVVYVLVRTHADLVATVACAGILVYVGIWITRLLTLREGSARAVGDGLDAYVELTRRRLTDDVRWGAFADRSMKVLGALLVPWAVWALAARFATYRAEPWRAFVGFGSATLLFVLSFLWNARKRRRLEAERERFEALVADRTLT